MKRVKMRVNIETGAYKGVDTIPKEQIETCEKATLSDPMNLLI